MPEHTAAMTLGRQLHFAERDPLDAIEAQTAAVEPHGATRTELRAADVGAPAADAGVGSSDAEATSISPEVDR